MSDTPETDAAAVTCYGECGIDESFGFTSVPIDVCRKLERERDEARSERDKAREQARGLANALETMSLVDLSPCNGGSCMIATCADDLIEAMKSRAATFIAKIKEGQE
jgi:hypothetical protein